MAQERTANWMDIDVETLPQAAQEAYAEYKVAQRKAAALRETFETTLTGMMDVPQGQRVVFGYRFGKLSAAMVEDDRKPAKAKVSKATLADFIAAQAASGRSA